MEKKHPFPQIISKDVEELGINRKRNRRDRKDVGKVYRKEQNIEILINRKKMILPDDPVLMRFFFWESSENKKNPHPRKILF